MGVLIQDALPPTWDGNGNGYGNGYGDGSGYGYGYGYGNGNGSGSGDGSSEYWAATVVYFATKWEPEQRVKLAEAQAAGAKVAFWRSDAKGLPANGGGQIKPAAPGIVHRARDPLQLCHHNTLHATLIPTKWNGERCWIVALKDNVIGDDEKFGALEREIIGECL